MFLRTKKAPTRKHPGRQAVQVVASRRVDGKVRQRIVDHVGYAADEDQLERLVALGELRRVQLEITEAGDLFGVEERERQFREAREALLRGGSDARWRGGSALRVQLGQLRETHRHVVGIHDVYGAVYRELGLDRLLPPVRYRASNEVLFHIVMARLAQPRSKQASVAGLEEDMGVRLSLSAAYRMMDHLGEDFAERLNRLALERARSLLPEPPRLWLFDCTTLYFESFVDDELRQPGYSKDGKFKESQVLLALMATPEGLPLRFDVLPGASFEGRSLVPAIEAMRREHGFDEVVCVADRGMWSAANMASLEGAGVRYVLGARLRSLDAATRERVLDRAAYSKPDADGIAKAVFPLDGDQSHRALVVSHCPAREERDRAQRVEMVDKLLARIEGGGVKKLIGNRGYARFVRTVGNGSLEIDEVKLAEAARWDGLAGVVTDLPAADNHPVLGYYRDLWRIEETFRVTKHDLRARPVFHWTPRRVRAHLAIAFMSLLCVRHLQHRVRTRYTAESMSPETIRLALTRMQQSVLVHQRTRKRYAMPSRVNETAAKLYRCVGLSPIEEPHELD